MLHVNYTVNIKSISNTGFGGSICTVKDEVISYECNICTQSPLIQILMHTNEMLVALNQAQNKIDLKKCLVLVNGRVQRNNATPNQPLWPLNEFNDNCLLQVLQMITKRRFSHMHCQTNINEDYPNLYQLHLDNDALNLPHLLRLVLIRLEWKCNL